MSALITFFRRYRLARRVRRLEDLVAHLAGGET